MSTALGLIINPVAGLGGRVGLKGSDGEAIQARARALGARPQSGDRASLTLHRLLPLRDEIHILTWPSEMGEHVARESTLSTTVLGSIRGLTTTAEDTVAAAEEMRRRGVALLLFAGGDGTARDIHRAVGGGLPALGIPAGVKILSGVFATHPSTAGDLAGAFLRGENRTLRDGEVLDLDEDAYRAGSVSPRLFGYLQTPYQRRLVQGRKSPSGMDERGTLQAIAADVIEQMQPGVVYVVGPGTTTRAILAGLGLEKTLVGVDVVLDRALLLADANEDALLQITREYPVKVVVTPIGGQGYLFGRGNQQISPEVLRAVGKENVVVVSSPEKLAALRGTPFLVDSGDSAVDRMLSGHVLVMTGYHERAVYRVGD